jgi:hypothetical protein
MHLSRSFALPVAAVLFGLVSPRLALATSEAKDCPVEPTQNVRIASGDVFYGPNCLISPAADLDSFQFNGKIGELYSLVAALNGGSNNICLDLYDPNQLQTFSACSNAVYGIRSVVTTQKLAASGLYTVVVYASGNNTTLQYGLSLERLNPAPPDGRQLTLGQPLADEINPLADPDAFTFVGRTTGTYRVTVSIPPVNPSNLCFTVYRPDGSSLAAPCTSSAYGINSIQLDVTPLQNGTHVVLLGAYGWDSTISYNLNVTCLVGDCGSGYPPCTLKDAPTYDATSGTLTMNFTVGNQFAAVWNGWLTYQNTIESLWSASQPVTDPPAAVTKTRPNLPKSGKVGILSTLTTPRKGITCYSWTLVDTGAP